VSLLPANQSLVSGRLGSSLSAAAGAPGLGHWLPDL